MYAESNLMLVYILEYFHSAHPSAGGGGGGLYVLTLAGHHLLCSGGCVHYQKNMSVKDYKRQYMFN